MLSQFFREGTNKMNIIYAEYNIHHNSIDIATTQGIFYGLTVGKQRKD